MSPSYVIPAPLVSEASKRDQAGTHAPPGLLSERTMGMRLPRAPNSTSKLALAGGLGPGLVPRGPFRSSRRRDDVGGGGARRAQSRLPTSRDPNQVESALASESSEARAAESPPPLLGRDRVGGNPQARRQWFPPPRTAPRKGEGNPAAEARYEAYAAAGRGPRPGEAA